MLLEQDQPLGEDFISGSKFIEMYSGRISGSIPTDDVLAGFFMLLSIAVIGIISSIAG